MHDRCRLVGDMAQFIDSYGRPCDHAETVATVEVPQFFSSSPEPVDIFVRNRDGHVSAVVAVKGGLAVFPHFSRSSGLSRS